MSQRSRQWSRAAAALVIVAPVTGGCSGGDAEKPRTAPSDSASASASVATTPPAVTTDVEWGELVGRISAAKRQQLAGDVQKVVDGWIDAAYLAGDYPRTDFTRSWPGFTPGAALEARRDANLTSNRDIGASIDGVQAQRRAVTLDVVSAGRRPVGVTAHVALRFTTAGATPQTVRVAGRLLLTPTRQGWQIFGYDVRKDAQ
jgi:hypothetical protein